MARGSHGSFGSGPKHRLILTFKKGPHHLPLEPSHAPDFMFWALSGFVICYSGGIEEELKVIDCLVDVCIFFSNYLAFWSQGQVYLSQCSHSNISVVKFRLGSAKSN